MTHKGILLLVLCLTAAGVANAQDAEDAPGQYYALLFAGDVYDHWNDLQNPINDARTLGNELRDAYGFEVDLVENPTQEIVLGKVRDYATRSYNKNDHVLIFFAGHGKFDEIDGEGYLVTRDSRSDDETNLSYIPYSQLRTRVNNIPSHHVLLVLDACFGGTFDPGVRGDDPPDNLAREEFIARKLRFQTRRYITSGGKEYVPDGRPGHHSPFMRQWLEALRTYGGRDGILTLGEIYQRLEHVDPLPISGQFGDNEPGSDFLFMAFAEETTPPAASDVPPTEAAPDAETGQTAEETVSKVRADTLPDEASPLATRPEQTEEETAQAAGVAEEKPPAEAATKTTQEPEADPAEATPDTQEPIETPQEAETETAHVDSIHVASTNILVDHVHASMNRVKEAVPDTLRHTPLYQEAVSLEERGRQLYDAGGYTQAAVRFDEARAMYEQAARAGVADEAIPPALQTAIDGYIETLKNSLEAEERAGMSAMAYRGRDWGAFFEAVHDITVEVRPGPVQVMNDGATLTVTLALTYKDAQEQPNQETLTHLWVLQDMGGWLLTRATPQP